MLANLLKALRYAITTGWNKDIQLQNNALAEKKLHDFPGQIHSILGNPEAVMVNGLGWGYQGLIEDQKTSYAHKDLRNL